MAALLEMGAAFFSRWAAYQLGANNGYAQDIGGLLELQPFPLARRDMFQRGVCTDVTRFGTAAADVSKAGEGCSWRTYEANARTQLRQDLALYFPKSNAQNETRA